MVTGVIISAIESLAAGYKLGNLLHMKNLIFFTLALFITLAPALPARADALHYSAVIEDLPLMNGMAENSDDAVIFDKPGGRIVESVTHIAASEQEIDNFYRQNLPALGWKLVSAGQFLRDGESLQIKIEAAKNTREVHFILTPNSK